MENRNNNNTVWAILISFMIGMATFSIMYWFIANNPTKVVKTKTEIIYDINDPYSEIKVRKYLEELHVKYIDVAIAQMKLESANGSSPIFKNNNNLFGMKNPKVRATTSLGEKDKHAYYSHWRQSVLDYALWQNFVSNAENLSTEKDWLDFIGRMYAEDLKYRNKIQKILSNIKAK